MATIIVTAVTFGDNEFTIVRNPSDVVSGGKDRTLVPEDVTSIFGAEVRDTFGGDEELRNRYRVVDTVERLTGAVVRVENGVHAGLSSVERSDGAVGKEFIDNVFAVKFSAINQGVTIQDSAGTNVLSQCDTIFVAVFLLDINDSVESIKAH